MMLTHSSVRCYHPQTEFWSLEVGAGKKATVTQKDEEDITTHITQASGASRR